MCKKTFGLVLILLSAITTLAAVSIELTYRDIHELDRKLSILQRKLDIINTAIDNVIAFEHTE
jgi:hypothetical protein|tara:strand:+ start:1578 stop:1766 length:189 start_codon:yes stop_codon:yes gene_type:complete